MRGLLVALALTLAACDSADGGAALRYALELREGGSAVAAGTLRFDARPERGTDVSGQYALTAPGGGPFPPLPQTSGPFEGAFEGDSLVVRIFVPGTSDTGLRLAGTYTAASYAGTWSEVTIAGPVPRGPFTATATDD